MLSPETILRGTTLTRVACPPRSWPGYVSKITRVARHRDDLFQHLACSVEFTNRPKCEHTLEQSYSGMYSIFQHAHPDYRSVAHVGEHALQRDRSRRDTAEVGGQSRPRADVCVRSSRRSFYCSLRHDLYHAKPALE